MIFWDLDGPILDVKTKYFRVYRDILTENNDMPLLKNEYWNLKRSKTTIADILTKSGCRLSPEVFNKSWVERIETPMYMKFDILQPDIIEVLKQCKQSNEMVLVTLRHSREMLLTQLIKLNLNKYFNDILSSGDNIKPRWKIKYNLINEYVKGRDSKNNVIIGDTETDILAGKKLGFKTIAVLCGIRNTGLLKSKPNKHYYKSSSLMENFL